MVASAGWKRAKKAAPCAGLGADEDRSAGSMGPGAEDGRRGAAVDGAGGWRRVCVSAARGGDRGRLLSDDTVPIEGGATAAGVVAGVECGLPVCAE
jgi:hypothetical protein